MKIAAATLLFVSLLALAACGGGHSSSETASRVCRQTHENPKLADALIQHQPWANIPNPTPATVITQPLGDPDQRIPTSTANVFWWRYANTAYLVAERPAHDLLLAKACNWKFTRQRLGD